MDCLQRKAVCTVPVTKFLSGQAGVYEDAFSPCPAPEGSPDTNFAKADQLLCWKPAIMVDTACSGVLFILQSARYVCA